MKIRTIATLITFGSVAALAACSSSETDKFASSDSFCSAKAEAECNGLAKKCGAENDACKTERTGICNTGAATAANQGRSYRANAAQDCIDSINGTYKNGGNDVTPEAEAETGEVCDRVFSGSKQESDTCQNTYECEGALICDKGVCIKEEKVATKGQCNNAGQTCETGAYCAQQGATKFCLEKKKLDEACNDPDTPCIESLRCLTGRCVAKVTAGNPCANDGECSSAAPYCDTTANKCRPKYESTSPACQPYGL
jgi:hypothetical protein